MSEMNDEVAVRELSSHGVVGGVDDPEFRTLGVSWTLIVIGPSWLHFSRSSSVATEGGKKSILLFCVPVHSGRIEPQMFHPQQLPQNNAV